MTRTSTPMEDERLREAARTAVDRLIEKRGPMSDEQAARIAYLLQPDIAPPLSMPPPPPPRPRPEPRPAKRRAAPVQAGVYFIRSGDLIKVGTSADVDARVRALRTMSPLPLELLAVAPGSHAEETRVHARFAHLRQHGEWFTAAPELLDFVGALAEEAS